MGTKLSKFSSYSPFHSPKAARSKSRKKGKLDKTIIGLPTDFRHMSHLGADYRMKTAPHCWPSRTRPGLVYPSDHFQRQMEAITLAVQDVLPTIQPPVSIPEEKTLVESPVFCEKTLCEVDQDDETPKLLHAATLGPVQVPRRPLPMYNLHGSIDDFHLPPPQEKQHGMSMLKSRLDSKIDAQIQKHARRRSRSCVHRLNKYMQEDSD